MKIDLPAVGQRRPFTCVAACLRSVLLALGSDYPEDALAVACRTEPTGATLRNAATAARSLGFSAFYLPEASFENLVGWLDQGVPMIVGVAADELDYGVTGGHAIAVCGVEDGNVIAMDPVIGSERPLSLEKFLRAWRRRGNRGLVIIR